MKQYTLATETVTKEEMTPREKQIFEYGVEEGIELGMSIKQGKTIRDAIFISFLVGLCFFFLALFYR